MISLEHLDLPKWPQMLVTGASVTEDQAFNILLRTDPFLTDASEYSGGNHRVFNQWYRDRSGLSSLRKIDGSLQPNALLKEKCHCLDTLEYTMNHFASSSFVYGPHGWCSPTGRIFFEDNVGKWPSATTLLTEWTTIAECFPFLNINVTLMSGEHYDDNIYPLVNFHVNNGQCVVQDPDISVHGHFQLLSRNQTSLDYSYHVENELGLPREWYIKYAKIVRNHIKELFPDIL